MIIPDLEEEGSDIVMMSLFEKIKQLVKSTPNDQELGEKIRKLINE